MTQPAPIICSVPNCGQPAVTSWQRLSRGQEAASYVQSMHASRQAIRQSRLDSLKLAIAQLRVTAGAFEQGTSVDEHRMAQFVNNRIAAIQAEHDAVNAEVIPTLNPTDVVVAVFTCATHNTPPTLQQSDLHQSTCCESGPCNCTSAATPPGPVPSAHPGGMSG